VGWLDVLTLASIDAATMLDVRLGMALWEEGGARVT
jgi:hypothetical protein